MRNAKVDDNQAAIVVALRKIGASVRVLSAVGHGMPDIVVGFRGANYLMEIKDGRKTASKRKLTPDEQLFHETWRGQVCVVNSAAEAIACLLQEWGSPQGAAPQKE